MSFIRRVKDYMFDKCDHIEGPIEYGLICGTCAAVVFSMIEAERNKETMTNLERILDSHDLKVKEAYIRGLWNLPP